MANQPSNGKKAVEEELIRGHDMANQLLEALVHKSNTHHHHHGDEEALILPLAQDLVHKVLKSFTNSLLVLNADVEDFQEEVVPNTIVRDFSSSANCTKPEDMNDASKSSNDKKHGRGRGRYKRKNYYRCTHKDDRSCPAIKQIQRIQEDLPLYRTTYYGHHTCKCSFIPDIVLEPLSSSTSSILLSFNSTLPNKQEHTFASPHLELAKQEPMEVIQDDHIAHNQLFPIDYLLSCDYELDWGTLVPN